MSHFVMHQNEFSFEVEYAMMARIGPSLMNQNILSLEVANTEYYFLHVGIFCDTSK